nr:hypothetical protein BaRGS_004586 [Batillaria attramentaria]
MRVIYESVRVFFCSRRFEPVKETDRGKLIYASYGRPQDFRTLEKMGVDTANAVVFIRYGKISRGRKSQTSLQ